MAEFLSQDEIEALLDIAEQGEDIESPFERVFSREKNYSIYDFKKPNRIDINSLKSFSMFFENLTNNILEKLQNTLDTNEKIDVKLYSVEQLTFEEFLLSCPQISNFNVLSSNHLKTKVITEINPEINNKIIASLLGIDDVFFQEFKDDLYDHSIDNINLTKIKNDLFELYYNDVILETLNQNIKKLFPKIKFNNIKNKKNSFHIEHDFQNNEIVLLSVLEINIGDFCGFLSYCFNVREILPLLKKLYKIYFQDINIKNEILIKDNFEDVKIINKIKVKNKDLIENTKLEIINNDFIEQTISMHKLFVQNDYLVNNVKILLGKNIINNLKEKENVIELEQLVNDPVEILIDDTKICDGEVIITKGLFGFKVKNLEENYIEKINNIECEYNIIMKDNKKYLALENILLFEINKDNILIEIKEYKETL